MPDSKNTSVVSATYNSPANEPFTAASNITTSTPIPSAALSLEDKTKFLQDLRASVATVQEQVNKELTRRMDEDKAREVAAGAASVDEAKEEQNYGEEVVDEDD